MPADRVDLVDEDDAGRALLALLEEIADPRCADTDKHLDKVRTRNREEGDIGLAGNGAGQQGLAGSGRAHEQHALGDLAAEALEPFGILEEIDDLLELVLGLGDAGDIFEGDLLLPAVSSLALDLPKDMALSRPPASAGRR